MTAKDREKRIKMELFSIEDFVPQLYERRKEANKRVFAHAKEKHAMQTNRL